MVLTFLVEIISMTVLCLYSVNSLYKFKINLVWTDRTARQTVIRILVFELHHLKLRWSHVMQTHIEKLQLRPIWVRFTLSLCSSRKSSPIYIFYRMLVQFSEPSFKFQAISNLTCIVLNLPISNCKTFEGKLLYSQSYLLCERR